MFEITDEMRDRAWRIIGAVTREGSYEIDTVETENGRFLIVGSWEALSALNDAINTALCPEAWAQWRPFYVERGGTGDPFSGLRIGITQVRGGEERPPYLIPDDLLDLEELAEVGFNDEYTMCDNCHGLVHTQPDCYGWTPDHWFDEANSECLCGDCVRTGFAEDYIEDLARKAAKGQAAGCHLLDPSDYGFELVAVGLEHGMHSGQADDPRELVRWAVDEAGLDITFSLRPGQFDVAFDVWMRGEDLDVGAVRTALLGYTEWPEGWRSDTLLPEFREDPDLATQMKASLKQASAAGERFATHHGDGTYTAYDTPEEMIDSMQEERRGL